VTSTTAQLIAIASATSPVVIRPSVRRMSGSITTAQRVLFWFRVS
jgi:hypothetical protein